MPIDFHLVEVPVGHSWAYDALATLSTEISVETYGEDRTVSLATLRQLHGDDHQGVPGFLAALPGAGSPTTPTGRFGLPVAPEDPAEMLASVEFLLPTLDNTHLVDDAWLQVDIRYRRQGIGRALWREVVRIGREHGRTTLVMWSDHALDVHDTSLPRVEPSTGAGDVPLGPAAGFALALGHRLEQVERQSRLLLPVDDSRLAALASEAEAHAIPRYRTDSWSGASETGRAEALARLNHAFSSDAPTGGIDVEPQEWDAARVHRQEERSLRTGELFTTVAFEASTGEPVAVTQLFCEYAHPHRVEQRNTVVSAPHRGVRLGLLVKVTNLRLLAASWPEAREVTTWNADENAPMLAINTALGYRPFARSAAWQRRIDGPSPW